MKIRKEYKWPIFKAISREAVMYFCLASTVMLMVNGGMAWFSGVEWVMYSRDMLRIFLAAFFAVVPIYMFAFFEESVPMRLSVLRVLHFTVTAVLVVGVLLIVEPTGRDFTLRTGILFLVIYAAVYAYGLYKDRKTATLINKRLDELHMEEV